MYTYAELKAFFDGRRFKDRNYRNGLESGSIAIHEETVGGRSYMSVYLYNTRIVMMEPDNTCTIHIGGWDSPSTRKYIWWFARVNLSHDRDTTGLNNRLRVGCSKAGSLPFIDGLRFRNGECLNPELCPPDEIARVKRSAITEVQRKLRPLKSLMLALARFDALERSQSSYMCVIPSDEELAEPTVEMASALYERGLAMTPGWLVKQKVAIESGLRWLRHELYNSDPNNFNVEVTCHGHDLRKAA
ncbi:hypothetical protein [Paraburkholderia sp. BL10I2N1]|uniref:hypothetical protein n=1 Tax=Paraburkholderia sp. BL10I2N1 TaxID=1938796 RepID=UPI00105E7AA8|nr:hypothetical protein [Paraburkholderia sp. BL10I2N1]TDN70468.1 hypothetical protein B0G77_3942 [Paraburkholderia sp. BL10I2N1]